MKNYLWLAIIFFSLFSIYSTHLRLKASQASSFLFDDLMWEMLTKDIDPNVSFEIKTGLSQTEEGGIFKIYTGTQTPNEEGL